MRGAGGLGDKVTGVHFDKMEGGQDGGGQRRRIDGTVARGRWGGGGEMAG